ncbi:uncharacterized [Tachysurus ichikawai]
MLLFELHFGDYSSDIMVERRSNVSETLMEHRHEVAVGAEGPPHGKSWASALTETCRHQNQAISEQVYTTLDSWPLENNEEL